MNDPPSFQQRPHYPSARCGLLIGKIPLPIGPGEEMRVSISFRAWWWEGLFQLMVALVLSAWGLN